MRSKIVIVVARVRVPVTLAAIAVILANIVAGFSGRCRCCTRCYCRLS